MKERGGGEHISAMILCQTLIVTSEKFPLFAIHITVFTVKY